MHLYWCLNQWEFSHEAQGGLIWLGELKRQIERFVTTLLIESLKLHMVMQLLVTTEDSLMHVYLTDLMHELCLHIGLSKKNKGSEFFWVCKNQ